MHIKSFLIAVFSLAVFGGCAGKESVIYKDVYLPVKCGVDIPKKPVNDKTFKAHKELMIYFLKIERLLKICAGKEDE